MSSTYRRWTKEETEFLEDHIGVRSYPYIAKKLNRTVRAVECKALSMGIADTMSMSGMLNAYQLSKLAGVDYTTVLSWTGKGLKHQRKIVSKKMKNVLIQPNDFWEFAARHKIMIDFTRIEPNTIPPEPQWVEEERRKQLYATPTRKRARWSPGEVQTLIDQVKSGRSFSDIAAYLGRSERAIQRYVSKLKEEGQLEKSKILLTWTEEETFLLLRLKEKGMTHKEIAWELGREHYHISDKLNRLRKAGVGGVN